MTPHAQNLIFGFENIQGHCPHCGEMCVFNRRSDLNTHEPIAGQAALCFHCDQNMWILGDSINDKCRFLLNEARDSLQSKKYMATVIYACMALERFFTFYLEHHFGLHNELTSEDLVEELEQRNADWQVFSQKMKRATYCPLRNGFIKVCLGVFPSSIGDPWENQLGDPPPSTIAGLREKKLRRLLRFLLKFDIGDYRNAVGHKTAYRPTKEEAERAFKLTEKLIGQLSGLLYGRYNACP